MPKVLFIASHRPDRSPSQRFRFEQYFSFLKQNGIAYELSWIISKEDDPYLYQNGNILRKFIILFRSVYRRWKDLKKANGFDVVFIQREALMIGSVWFENRIKKKGIPLIYDFDDSIWILDTSEGNKKWEWLKNPGKTKKIIKIADLVFAGNKHLAEYAKQFNTNVKIIPTTVDTDKFEPDLSKRKKEQIVIGWSGSITTIKHFNLIVPTLIKLKNKYGDKIIFKVVGDSSYENKELGIVGTAWSPDTEVDVLNSFDIGIMPLPDDKWAKGKCGLKGLSYMALEIPTVMSPVGVNCEIIENGVNGFLAKDEDEWLKILSALIEDEELRSKTGKKARKTVTEKYSVTAQKKNYLNAILEIIPAAGKSIT